MQNIYSFKKKHNSLPLYSTRKILCKKLLILDVYASSDVNIVMMMFFELFYSEKFLIYIIHTSA